MKFVGTAVTSLTLVEFYRVNRAYLYIEIFCSEMKSFFKFVLFTVAFVGCIIDESVNAKSKTAKIELFCDDDRKVLPIIAESCPGLDSEKTVSSYIAPLVDAAIKAVALDCDQHSHLLCNILHNPVERIVKSVTKQVFPLISHWIESHDVCKTHVGEAICEHPIPRDHDFWQDIYRPYSISVRAILEKEDNFHKGDIKLICNLFKPNEHLYNLVKTRKCKIIKSMMPKKACTDTMKTFKFSDAKFSVESLLYHD